MATRLHGFVFAVLVAAFVVGCSNPTGSDNGYDGPTGTVGGTVTDATTGDAIADVEIVVSEYDEFSTSSDANGEFEFDTPTGDITLLLTRSGFVFPEVSVTVSEAENTVVSAGETAGSPALEGDGIRIVLSWGESPSDLDSHLYTPDGSEVYYINRRPTGAGANLDRDDTFSYGPETITVTEPQSGTYRYFVHNFSGTPELPASEAIVRVYDSSSVVATYTAPTSGTGDWWHVIDFQVDGNTVTILTEVDALQTDKPSEP